MIKIAILGIVATFLSLMIKKEKPELSLMICLACAICIFTYSITQMTQIIDFVKRLIDLLPIDSIYFVQMMKMLQVAYMAEFASAICRESGREVLAGQINFFAKIAIVIISIPSLIFMADTMGKLL